MAAVKILEDQTTDTTSTGTAVTGPCSVWVRGLNGAECLIQVAQTDVAGDYETLNSKFFVSMDQFVINLVGAYFVRAILQNSTATTNATVTVSQ